VFGQRSGYTPNWSRSAKARSSCGIGTLRKAEQRLSADQAIALNAGTTTFSGSSFGT